MTSHVMEFDGIVEEPEQNRSVPVVQNGALPTQQHDRNSVAPVSTGNTAIDMMFEAVRRGTSVDELAKLLELHNTIETRAARKSFFDAMARFQAECPPIKKGHKKEKATDGGGNFGYTYATLDEIARVVNPILARHGLSYSHDQSFSDRTVTVICVLKHVDGHSETSTVAMPIDSNAGMSNQQKVGNAVTYGRRYALVSALGLSTTDEDTDGADVDVEYITADQADTLEALLEEVGGNRARFLKYCGVSDLKMLPAKKFNGAVKKLEERRANA